MRSGERGAQPLCGCHVGLRLRLTQPTLGAHPMTRHAIAAGTLFDGERLHHDCTVVIEGERIAAIEHGVRPAARRPGLTHPRPCPPGGHLARAGLHRLPGERRRRCAVQRCADARDHRPDRRGAQKARHHGAAADADQRYAGEDAGGDGRRPPGGSRQPRRARHSPGGAVPLAREAGGARSRRVPRARRGGCSSPSSKGGRASCS